MNCKKAKLIFLTILFLGLFGWAESSQAARSIALPFEELFNTSAYTADLVWTTGGATHIYESDGGWEGGCAKFTPSTLWQGYSALGSFTGLNTQRLNIRYLQYLGTTYVPYASNDPVGKSIILDRSTAADGDRAMLVHHGYADNAWDAAACANIECNYPTPKFNIANYKGQWVCYEFEADIVTGIAKVYVTTPDGAYNEHVLVSRSLNNVGTGTWGQIQIIGWFAGPGTADVNNYYKIDELKISNTYVGPPDGFIGTSPDTTPPAAPSGLSVN